MSTGVEATLSRDLGIEEIESILVGAAFYGCGGGGSLIEGRILVSALAGRLGSRRVALMPLDGLPEGEDDRIEWLHRHWCDLDRWIDERTRARAE